MNPLKWSVLHDFKGKIEKPLKEGRLVFLTDSTLSYVDGGGVKKEYSFHDFVNFMYDKFGFTEHLDKLVVLGIMPDDIEKILADLYRKHK